MSLNDAYRWKQPSSLTFGAVGQWCGPFLQIAESFRLCHVSTDPAFAVADRIHPFRRTPHKIDSPLNGSENGRIPAGFADSIRHPSVVRSSTRSVVSRNRVTF